jgi:hypothetical protein
MTGGVARLSRALIAVLMVGAIAGAAVAFSLGVNFAPRSACNPSTVSYGSSCPSNKHNLHKLGVRGLAGLRAPGTHGHLSITNHTGTKVRIKLVLLVQTPSGQIKRITRVFTLKSGKRFELTVPAGLRPARAVKLKLTITDSSGNIATSKRRIGTFKH